MWSLDHYDARIIILPTNFATDVSLVISVSPRIMYNNCPTTLPYGTPEWIGKRPK